MFSPQAYLILPVQRIPRYVLLLRAIIHETEDAHPDLALCQQAAEKMELVGTQVNERRREYEAEEERQQQLRDLTASIANLKQVWGYSSLLDDDREVLQQGDVVYYDPAEQGKRMRSYALCSDLLLLLESFRHPGLLKHQRAIRWKAIIAVPLKGAYLTDLSDGTQALGGVKARNSFLLHSKSGGVLCLSAETPARKTELLGAIEQALLKVNQR